MISLMLLGWFFFLTNLVGTCMQWSKSMIAMQLNMRLSFSYLINLRVSKTTKSLKLHPNLSFFPGLISLSNWSLHFPLNSIWINHQHFKYNISKAEVYYLPPAALSSNLHNPMAPTNSFNIGIASSRPQSCSHLWHLVSFQGDTKPCSYHWQCLISHIPNVSYILHLFSVLRECSILFHHWGLTS